MEDYYIFILDLKRVLAGYTSYSGAIYIKFRKLHVMMFLEYVLHSCTYAELGRKYGKSTACAQVAVQAVVEYVSRHPRDLFTNNKFNSDFYLGVLDVRYGI